MLENILGRFNKYVIKSFSLISMLICIYSIIKYLLFTFYYRHDKCADQPSVTVDKQNKGTTTKIKINKTWQTSRTHKDLQIHDQLQSSSTCGCLARCRPPGGIAGIGPHSASLDRRSFSTPNNRWRSPHRLLAAAACWHAIRMYFVATLAYMDLSTSAERTFACDMPKIEYPCRYLA